VSLQTGVVPRMFIVQVVVHGDLPSNLVIIRNTVGMMKLYLNRGEHKTVPGCASGGKYCSMLVCFSICRTRGFSFQT